MVSQAAFQRTIIRGEAEAIEPRLFDRTESFRFLDKSGCLEIGSLSVPDSPMTLARVRSTGHEILLEEPERFSIILPWAGTVRSEVRGEILGAGVNGVLLFDPNRRRTTVVPPSRAAPYVADLLTVPKSALEEAIRENDLPPGLTRHLLVWQLPVIRELRAMISRTLSQCEHDTDPLDTDASPHHLSAGFADAISAVVIACAGGSVGLPSAGRRRVRKAIDLMEALHAEPLSITDICRRLGCSCRSLQLAFSEAGLPPPHEILTRIRLDHARIHLLGGGMAVTQAAVEAGFVHLGRFSSLYRLKFGEYPAQTLARG